MEIFNTEFKTNPFVVHAQGIAHKQYKWYLALDNVIKETLEIAKPEDLTIVTFGHGSEKYLLLNQLKKANVEYINLCNFYKEPKWQNVLKIKYLYENIDKIKTKYILQLDSIDCLVADNLPGIVEEFKKMNCKVLFGATKNNHPNKQLEDGSLIQTEFKFLNAGTMIGEVKYVKKFFTDLIKDYLDKKFSDFPNSDQYRIKAGFDKHKDYVAYDSGCKIFQTLDKVNYIFRNNNFEIYN